MSPRCACGKHALLGGGMFLTAGPEEHSAGGCRNGFTPLAGINVTATPPVTSASFPVVPSPRVLDATLDQLEAAITRAIIAARPVYTVEAQTMKSALEALGDWNDSLRGPTDRIAGAEVRP